MLIDEKTYQVEIDQPPFSDKISRVILNGKPVDIVVSSDWQKQFSKCLIIGTMSYQVEFESDKQGIPKRVYFAGGVTDVSVDFPGKAKLSEADRKYFAADGNRVRASLPGKVIGIRVEPGQRVKTGEVLCLLEAMKMENELISHKDAVVKEILVRENDKVESGQVLIILE